MTRLAKFLARNHASESGLARLAATGATTAEEAWERADDLDLIWAVTRPGVMSAKQRRYFLTEAVLSPIESLLIDERSKNVLQKLRANEPITVADRAASWMAIDAADETAWTWFAAYATAETAASVAASDMAYAAYSAYSATAWAMKAKQTDQAGWLRKNFVFSDMNLNGKGR